MKKLSTLKDEVEGWHKLSTRIKDTFDLAEMNEDTLRSELETETEQIEDEVARRELDVLLSGRYDRGNALLEVSSGAGGTDSQDWAAMLERMYIRWAEKNGYDCEILDSSEGEERE